MKITWDEDNATDHLEKHGIDFNEVSAILQNQTTILDLKDSNHSNFYALGFRYTGVLLRISYNIQPDAIYKIITAFKSDVEDRKLYRNLMRSRLL